MRFKTFVTLVFATSLCVVASSSAAQAQAQNPPPQPPTTQSEQGQQQSTSPAEPGQRRMEMRERVMGPGMMEMTGPMMRDSREGRERGEGPGGPLQRVSRLLTTLDDPRVRTMLGLSDQQADSLRKIVVDTEVFTIKQGADIAVNSIELRELLRADKPERSTVMSKGDEISKSTSQLINHYLDAMLAAKAILTPEQQKMIREYIERGAPALPRPGMPPPSPGRP
jgi:Spy/CpxP family protein refolding chaperone